MQTLRDSKERQKGQFREVAIRQSMNYHVDRPLKPDLLNIVVKVVCNQPR
jgi:hypothetical protein